MRHQNKIIQFVVQFVVLIFSMATLGNSQAKFSFFYNATYVCQSVSGSRCEKWQLNITIVEQTLACFPHFQKVMTRNGPRQMRHLQIGDELLSYDSNNGTVVYSKMTSWLHKLDQDNFQSKYLKITTDQGSFHISPLHNIAIRKNQALEYVYAQNLTIADQLFFGGSKIQEIQVSNELGLYTPLTQNFNFFLVSSRLGQEQVSNQDLILVHCFANIQQPTFYEPLFTFFQMVFEYLGLAKYTHRSIDGISPLAKTLMRIFPYFLDEQNGVQMTKPNGDQFELILNQSLLSANTNNDNDASQRRAITFISFLSEIIIGI